MLDVGDELAGRYEIEALLGKGGMGAVYRALDRSSGRELAVKCMLAEKGDDRAMAYFEREYATLSQLAHPSVIEVYEYAIADGVPFYTMELLDGVDLSKRAPLPPVEACSLLHDIASSLALLHARGFVHRDVTARNIRVGAHGRAKLIDFGAIAPFGRCGDVAGTPMYIAPELVLGQRIDGRADLYSLGVTLYYAVTRRFPYPARALRELRSLWQRRPAPPDQLVEGLPMELVQLILALIALDPTSRPRSAADVMERLAAIAGLEQVEAPEASRAYLVAPALEGRAVEQQRMRGHLVSCMRGRGGGLLFAGEGGVGRSRMLDAAALEAKVMGANVVRVAVEHCHGRRFDAARALLEQLVTADETFVACVRADERAQGVLLRDPADPATAVVADLAGAGRLETIRALRGVLLAYSRKRPLVIVADDLGMLDEPSVAMLASLLGEARGHRLLLVGAIETGAASPSPTSQRLLEELCTVEALAPLEASSTERLLEGVFGAVPHVGVVAHQIHRLSGGRPREILSLARQLVESGVVVYRAGSWVLPAALEADALPRSLTEAMARRCDRLTGHARDLARRKALSPLRSLGLDELVRLGGRRPAATVHTAIDELTREGVLVAGDDGYALAHDGWAETLLGGLADAERRGHHLELARLHERDGRDPLLVAYHQLLGGEARRALEVLDAYCRDFDLQTVDVFDETLLDATALGVLFAEARRASDRDGASPALRTRLRQFMLAAGTVVDPRWFFEVAEEVERDLRRQSGHDHWQALDPSLSPTDRAFRALQQAQATHEAASESERGQAPAEALPSLVQFTVASMVVSLATCDFDRLRRLPELIRPFAPLSPILQAVMSNMLAVLETVRGNYEESRRLYLEVLDELADVDVAALEHADEIRAGVTFGTAVVESRMGMIGSAERRLAEVEDDRRMRGNVLSLRAVLAQHVGDWARARGLKQRARRLAIEGEPTPLFGQDSLPAELDLCALGLDLGGVKQLLGELEQLAERYPTWQAVLSMARADHARLRGDPGGALEHLERCLSRCGSPGAGQGPVTPWHQAAASKIEVLTELGRVDEAVEYGAALVDRGKHPGQRHHRIVRALALAEGRGGRCEVARGRLSGLLETMQRWGAEGVELGLVHEALAWVAAWAQDREAFREHATRTSAEYHRVSDSALAARYARLRAALRHTTLVSDIPPLQSIEHASVLTDATGRLGGRVASTLDSCSVREDRAQRGLSLLCDLAQATSGFLFLLEAGGLSLVASTPGARPDDSLIEIARRVLEAQSDPLDDAMPTEVVSEGPAAFGDEPAAAWIDTAGRPHHTLAIRASLGGESTLVGVALLGGVGAVSWSAELAECAELLGERFLRVGDTTLRPTGGPPRQQRAE